MDQLEVSALTQCEGIITRGLKSFVEVGPALAEIRDRRLYRDTHGTFEDYCQERWGFTRRSADRIIEASDVAQNLRPIGLAPRTESQARELVGLEPQQAAQVMTAAQESGPITAAAIREARERVIHPELLKESEPVAPYAEWSEDEHLMRRKLENGLTVVVNMRNGGHPNLIVWAVEQGLYVRVDRKSEWGNPFEMPDDGDRDTVIAKYAEHYLPYKDKLRERLPQLRGKALGCWCAPEPCHGDVLRLEANR